MDNEYLFDIGKYVYKDNPLFGLLPKKEYLDNPTFVEPVVITPDSKCPQEAEESDTWNLKSLGPCSKLFTDDSLTFNVKHDRR